MGRYAFFNTEFEYKFVFAVQASQAIEQFGGYVEYDKEGNDACIEWTEDDYDTVDEILRDIEADYGYSRPDLSLYEKTLQGTNTLCDDIKYGKYDDEVYYGYVLGLLILHQLSYTPDLSAVYEL